MKTLYKTAASLIAFLGVPQLGHAGIIWDLNGHEYELVNAEGVSWTGANALATDGWHLATVTSLAENDFIVGNLLQGLNLGDRSHYWIGATDSADEGSYAWVTGEAWDYTNWWLGEHNNYNNEDYVAYDLRGAGWGWNDAPVDLNAGHGGIVRGYIMERSLQTLTTLSEPVSVPEPTSLLLLGTGLLAAAFARRKRA